MEKLIFALLCLSSFSSTFGQKVTFGINMGLNYDYLQLKEDPSLAFPLNLTTEDKIGFQIGIHSLIHVADRVKLSPQAILAFSEYAYDYNIGNSTDYASVSENVFIKFPVDLHLELLKGKTGLYVFSGVEYAYNVAKDEDVRVNTLDIKQGFWSGRVGLGFRQDFRNFAISPEFTFIKSFSDIEKENNSSISQAVTNLDSSIVGLSIKFQGLMD